MLLSENVRELQPSATLAVAALCRQLRAAGRDILDLSAGEPDFRTPEFIAQAGIAAIEQGFTRYTPVAGTPVLRESIAGYLSARSGRTIQAAQIVVSTGAKQALFNACFTLLGPGDEVLVPVPYWTSYPEILHLARARSVFVATDDASGRKVDVAALEAARTAKTRGLILNSPANPHGSVYSLEELRAIVDWAAAHDISILADEIYGRLSFTGDRAPSVLDLDRDIEHVVVIDGASKAFAMTGWRIGFSCSTAALATDFASLQSQITSNPSSPAQAAAVGAFQDEPRVEEAVGAMVRVFRRRRDRVIELLQELLPRARFAIPEGAFYVFFSVDDYFTPERSGSIAFCNWLVESTGVALVPGAAFGDDRCVRLSFAVPEAEIVEGVRRMARALTTT